MLRRARTGGEASLIMHAKQLFLSVSQAVILLLTSFCSRFSCTQLLSVVLPLEEAIQSWSFSNIGCFFVTSTALVLCNVRGSRLILATFTAVAPSHSCLCCDAAAVFCMIAIYDSLSTMSYVYAIIICS